MKEKQRCRGVATPRLHTPYIVFSAAPHSKCLNHIFSVFACISALITLALAPGVCRPIPIEISPKDCIPIPKAKSPGMLHIWVDRGGQV